jgi:hypothetical protein
VIGALLAVLAAAPPVLACGGRDTCAEPARAGEVALVFIGDSGYGQGGASEWGSHAQGQVAAQLAKLCPRPDLVFFLGDNVYWRGSPDLFGPRFDTVYAQLFDPDHQRVHAALGNHDVKGCQVSTRAAFAPEETCGHALYRLVVEDVERDAPPGEGATATPLLDPGVLARAQAVAPLECPPAFDLAYEQNQESGLACFATQALRHPTFGYGLRGDNPLRYYTIDHPPADEALDGRPRVRVLVTDTNTLRRGEGGDPGHGDERVLEPKAHDPAPVRERWDRLQALWLENQLRTAPEGAWTMLAMHHPPFTPRACAFKLLGRCVGGHGDDLAVRRAMFPAWERPSDAAGAPPVYEPFRPDVVWGAHNHLYARTRPIDASGYPTTARGQGIRHIVTGGGGAPLYRLQPLHQRYAAGGAFHHFTYVRLRGEEAFFWVIDDHGRVRDSFCFTRGESIDHCIARGTYDEAEIACAPEPAPATGCPLPKRR